MKGLIIFPETKLLKAQGQVNRIKTHFGIGIFTYLPVDMIISVRVSWQTFKFQFFVLEYS